MRLSVFLAAKNSRLFHLVLFYDKNSLDATQPLHNMLYTISLCLIQKQFHIKLKPIYQNHKICFTLTLVTTT